MSITLHEPDFDERRTDVFGGRNAEAMKAALELVGANPSAVDDLLVQDGDEQISDADVSRADQISSTDQTGDAQPDTDPLAGILIGHYEAQRRKAQVFVLAGVLAWVAGIATLVQH